MNTTLTQPGLGNGGSMPRLVVVRQPCTGGNAKYYNVSEASKMAVDNNNNAVMSPDSAQQFIHLAKSSPLENPRNSCTADIPHTPKWVQPELIRKGQEFIQQHFFIIYFAHFISLIFLFCYEPIRNVLLSTQRSDTKPKALIRYFNTLSHIQTWYEGDLLDESSPASMDLHGIRRVHASVAASFDKIDKLRHREQKTTTRSDVRHKARKNSIVDAVSSDLRNRRESAGKVEVPAIELEYLNLPHENPSITQLDMIITQFCFMGFISLYPKALGIQMSSHKQDVSSGHAGFVHLWALIGYRLGIEDQFNLCLQSNLERQIIIQNLLLNALELQYEQSEFSRIQILWESLVDGISSFIPFLSLPAMLLFAMKNIIQFPDGFTQTSKLYSLFTLYDSICYQLMCWCFNSWVKINVLASMFNFLLRLGIFCLSVRLELNKVMAAAKLSKYLTFA